jgi:hypothetical protein
MKDIGAFFYVKNKKVYFCIYAKTDYINKLRKQKIYEKGKLLIGNYDNNTPGNAIISYHEFNENLKIIEIYDYKKYTAEEFNKMMEKKEIYKKGMKLYSSKWFQEKLDFIKHQVK